MTSPIRPTLSNETSAVRLAPESAATSRPVENRPTAATASDGFNAGPLQGPHKTRLADRLRSAVSAAGDHVADLLVAGAPALHVSAAAGTGTLGGISLSWWPWTKKVENPQAALLQMASSGPTDRHKALANTMIGMLAECRFRETKADLLPLAAEALQAKKLDDGDVADLFAKLVKKATADNSTGGGYIDDKSVVARHGADFLRAHGDTDDTRKIADLMAVVLSPVKFTESNVGIAKAGFAAISSRDGADDRRLVKLLGRMVDQSENTVASNGRFQADKSKVLAAAMPWLKRTLTEPASQKLLGLTTAALARNTFADSDADIAAVAFTALASGDASDRALAKVAAAMTKAAHAGDTSSYAYRDDKTGVALRSAEFIANNAEHPSTPAWVAFMAKVLDRTSFTTTVAAVATVAFDRIAAGDEPTERTLAATAAEMVKKAVSTTSTSHQYVDDKTRVASNAIDHIRGRLSSPEATLLADMGKEAMRGARYTESATAIAQEVLKGLERGVSSRADIAAAAVRMIDAGTVSEYQDKTPIAEHLILALANAETQTHRSRLALLTLASMMKNDADFNERAAVAREGVRTWGEANPAEPLDPYAWARTFSSLGKTDNARVKMLTNAVRTLADDRGPKFADEAKAHIGGLWRLGSDAKAYRSLIDFAGEMERKPAGQETVERMAAALNETAQPSAEAPKVEVQEEFIVIGGVRIQKKSSN